MAVLELGLLILALLFVFYKWATAKYKVFEERGLPFEKPLPLVGNSLAILQNKESFFKSFLDFYRRNKQHKIVGYYNFREPMIMVNDPEFIKRITVKDFEYFPNHVPFFTAEQDPLIDSMITLLKDQRWKDMRNTLSPIFTSSKMRAMFALMNESFDESLTNLRENCTDGDGYEFELKQYFTKLSNDIIASTAFGLRVNSYKDQNNQFYKIGQSITNFRGKQMLKFLISSAVPRLANLLNIRVFDVEKTSYFMRLVVDAMKYREENNIVRPDMIQLLIEAKKESAQWTDADLVAQCFIFFFAAFENNANLICLMCHELMANPDVQQRLYEEAVEIRSELNGARLNYDIIGKMKYMDMVVSETLRKWALAVAIDRVCSKDYKLTDDDGNFVFEFKAGDRLWFPIVGLQWDEQYFDDPETFDPERFSDENKNNIKPFTYLPFGVGPRSCIGNRYALMQAKAMVYYLILDFKMERTAKTADDLLKDMRGFQLNPQNGFWMRFVPRK